jgi:hypothetical protein
MAYDQKAIYEQAQEQIKKNNLFFIEDIVAFIPCDKTTFYRFFPVDCNEYNTLKALLEENRVKTKSAIRSKLFKGSKASELLALYKLICTDQERDALMMQKVDHSTKGKSLNVSILNIDPLSNEDDNGTS